MNKPDVVRARAEMVAAQKAAEEAIRAFEEAQMMADGYARGRRGGGGGDARGGELPAEGARRDAVRERRHQYTSTIITTTTVVKSTTVSKTDEDAAVEASEAMEVAAADITPPSPSWRRRRSARARSRSSNSISTQDAERKRPVEEAEEKRLAVVARWRRR